MKNLLQKVASKKHVIWDWNGTLLNDVHHVVSIINEILVDHSLPTINETQYKDLFMFPVREYYKKLGFQITQKEFEDLSHRFVDTFNQRIHNCSLFPYSKPILQQIKASKKRQSILSATDQVSLNWVVEKFEVHSLLDAWYGIGDKMASSKLARGHELIADSGISPIDTILIGDTNHDLEVGQELGVEVILLAHGHQSEARLRHVHHDVLQINPYHHPNV